MSLRNTPNTYWQHREPPPDCCMSIVCSALNRDKFRDYVQDLAKAGIYYSHDVAKRTVTLAFGTPAERMWHESFLAHQAREQGALIEVA